MKLHCDVAIKFFSFFILILCTKDSAYTTGRIQSYTLFLLRRNGNGVIIRSWIINFVQNQADAASVVLSH